MSVQIIKIVTLRVIENIFDKFQWLISHFNSNEISVINVTDLEKNTEDFDCLSQEKLNELKMCKNGNKLRKSRNRVLAGVAGGLAEFLDWKPKQIRVVWIIATLFSGGVALIVYAGCAYLFPPPADFDINNFREQ